MVIIWEDSHVARLVEHTAVETTAQGRMGGSSRVSVVSGEKEGV